jgi:hypothetical protein
VFDVEHCGSRTNENVTNDNETGIATIDQFDVECTIPLVIQPNVSRNLIIALTNVVEYLHQQ